MMLGLDDEHAYLKLIAQEWLSKMKQAKLTYK